MTIAPTSCMTLGPAMIFKCLANLGLQAWNAWTRVKLLASLSCLAVFTPTYGLTPATEDWVQSERLTDSDLEVHFADASSEPVFISRDSLYAMTPDSRLIYLPYTDSEVQANVIPLKKILELFEFSGDGAMSAESYDGYYSLYPSDFIEAYAPYLVLDLEGLERGDLHPEGAPDLGPYYITFEERLEQGSSKMEDPDNKRPFGVNKITLGTYQDLVAIFYAGPLAALEGPAASGRELYLNNCLSCHAWDRETGPGGDFSNRTTNILSVHAKYNKDYFAKYVVNPTQFIPDVKMPKHPHYTDEQIESIRLFLAEVPVE